MNSIVKMMDRLTQKGAVSNVVDRSEAGVNDAVASRLAERRNATSSHRILEIDLNALVMSGYLPKISEASNQYEEFRRIKRPILKKSFDNNVSGSVPTNLVLITSSLRGEGKTFCTLNLALNMILERDITVMIIDADCMRRSLSKLLGLGDSNNGLVEVLTDEISIEDAIVSTSSPQLKIVPAGQFHSHTAELLASDRMKGLMKEMAARYPDRIILIDAPPLMVSSDAEILSHYVGQVLMVVEAENTSSGLVERALNSINPRADIGLLLNKRRPISRLLNEGVMRYSDYVLGDDTSKAE